MSSYQSDGNKLQKAGQKTNELIDLVLLHHLLAVTVTSLPSAEGAEERKRLAAIQMKIETLSFDIMKTAKLNKKLSESKRNEAKQAPGFTQLCNNLREALELFKRDLYKLIFIQRGFSDDVSGFLQWEGMPTGIHSSALLHENMKSAKSLGNPKEDGRKHATRMEDVLQKITFLVKSLVSNVSVQVWTVENYSSIVMPDWDDGAARATCLSGILNSIRSNRKMMIGLAATTVLVLTLAIVGIVLLIV